MPVSDAAARALAFLASEVRAETYGAGDWDPPGTIANIEAVRSMTLAEVMRAVSRLAEDPKAKTPGGLRDTRNPCWRERSEVRPVQRNPRPADMCADCGKRDGPGHPEDHPFERRRRSGGHTPDEFRKTYNAVTRGPST